MDMKLELIPIPVVDVDRAKAFYIDKLGFKEDVDVRPAPGVRVVQMTPPGSACSISIGTGLPVYERSERASNTRVLRTPMATALPSKKWRGVLESTSSGRFHRTDSSASWLGKLRAHQLSRMPA
jgi:catechol 2,3-dioxygenase-like lactoylglutathione lyase family enzyme